MNSDVHGFKQMFDVRQAFERQNTRTLLGHANIWDRKEKAERLQSSTRSFLFIDYPKSYISSLYISRTVCVFVSLFDSMRLWPRWRLILLCSAQQSTFKRSKSMKLWGRGRWYDQNLISWFWNMSFYLILWIWFSPNYLQYIHWRRNQLYICEYNLGILT